MDKTPENCSQKINHLLVQSIDENDYSPLNPSDFDDIREAIKAKYCKVL